MSFTGVIAVTSILDNFDFSIHPSVTAGLIDPEHAREEMMMSLGGGMSSSTRMTSFSSICKTENISCHEFAVLVTILQYSLFITIVRLDSISYCR